MKKVQQETLHTILVVDDEHLLGTWSSPRPWRVKILSAQNSKVTIVMQHKHSVEDMFVCLTLEE